jgi:hypothetical protein
MVRSSTCISSGIAIHRPENNLGGTNSRPFD